MDNDPGVSSLGQSWLFIVGAPARYGAVCAFTAERFEGFTSWMVDGFWRGRPEASSAILVGGLNAVQARDFARDLATAFDQEAVYFQSTGHGFLAGHP